MARLASGESPPAPPPAPPSAPELEPEQMPPTHVPLRQAAVTTQGPPGRLPHRPSTAQTPDRQVSDFAQGWPLPLPHLPSAAQMPARQASGRVQSTPTGRPQMLSAPQVPPRQTRAPVLAVHVLEIGGPGGRGWPLGTFGAQVPMPGIACGLSHHMAPQSASIEQDEPQAPLATLHTGPACAPVMQARVLLQRPQPPAGWQKGAAAVGQGRVEGAPLSPAQAAQRKAVGSQDGVEPVQRALLAAVHSTQR